MAILYFIQDLVTTKWPVLLTTLLAPVLVFVILKIQQTIRLWKIPVIGQELGDTEKRRRAYLGGARRLYLSGYEKFRDGIFRITTSRKSNIIVLSPKFLSELKSLPDNIVSFSAAIDDSMETKYTKIETDVPIVPHTVKVHLTPALVRLNPTIATEVQEALDVEMPNASTWTEIDIHHILLRVVAMVSGRVFIGPELCRNEQYIDVAIDYTLNVMTALRAVQDLRPWMRPFLADRLPAVRKLHQTIKNANALLEPVVRKRREEAGSQKRDDMLQWLMDGQHKFPDENSQNLAKIQLDITFAAIHTTTLTAANAFYELAASPSLAAELREEVQQALEENEGIFTSRTLQSVKKMDSFLKETLRLYPASMTSFQRKVLQPFTLSNGQVIPAGVIIEVPAIAMNSDPDLFPDPEKFDPLRFYHLREEARASSAPEKAALNQFVSVSQNSITFGFGRHACPGRFFAANEIKMILANVLLKWDVKNAGGFEGRYPNVEFAHMSIPDASRKLLCRERSI